TNDVTRQTVHENRVASLRRYRQRLGQLVRELSATERVAPISPEFREALTRRLEQSGVGKQLAARNPGEVFRQYLACMLRRPDARRGVPGCKRSLPVRFLPTSRSQACRPKPPRRSACSR